MSDQKLDGIYIISAPAVMAFQNLFTPRRYKDPDTGKESGDPKYDGMFVFEPDHPDLNPMKELVKSMLQSAFPGEVAEAVNEAKALNVSPWDRIGKTLQLPWKSGDQIIADAAENARKKGKKAPDNEHLRGKVCITARSQYAPLLNAIVNKQLVKYRDDARPAAEKAFYPGVKVLVEFNFQPHKVGSNKPGVTAYLNELVSTVTGDRIAGGTPTEEKFGAYIGHVSTVDPTASAPGSAEPW